MPNVEFRGDWWQLLILAAIFGVINAYIRPVVKLLSLPLTIVTFGLIGLVINIAMVLLAACDRRPLQRRLFARGLAARRLTLDTIIAAFLTSSCQRRFGLDVVRPSCGAGSRPAVEAQPV